MKQALQLGYSTYITDSEELDLLKSVILPKLKQGKPVNLFCSFSYFTSNYTGIFFIHELSNLVKEGCTLYLVMWDINSKSHRAFRRILQQQEHKITADEIIENKMVEIRDLLTTFKAPSERIHVYRASDVLQRFMKKQEPNLFLQFYSLLEKIELNDLLHKHKASHIVQMPMDMFFANYFHELYPEDAENKIDVTLAYPYQEKIYYETRKIMCHEEMINNLSPLLLVLPPHPYLLYNDNLPEWDMNKDTVITHVLSCDVPKEKIVLMYYVILSKILNSFEILDKDDKVKTLPWEKFKEEHKKLSLNKQRVSLGYNVYNYLQTVKQQIVPSQQTKVLRLTNDTDMAKYGKLLARKPLLNILKYVDGKKNATQLSKELQIARSNMSHYLRMLKRNGLIDINEDGSIHRTISAINTNFEVGVH